MSPRLNPLGEFERAVLMAIARLGSDAYGVPIKQILENRLGRRVSTGAVYTTLDRLEEKGFVTSWLGEPSAVRGGRAKRFYRVEADGSAALSESRDVTSALWSLHSPVPDTR
jgi:PadR family transcriptional regulator, regulatory protein PadR